METDAVTRKPPGIQARAWAGQMTIATTNAQLLTRLIT